MAGKRYIGGSADEARKKYVNLDKKLQIAVGRLSKEYGIQEELMWNALFKEGVIDNKIRSGNDTNWENESSIVDDKIIDLFDNYGLDHIFDEYGNSIKTKRDILIERAQRENEKGDLVNSGVVNVGYDALELLAAKIKNVNDYVKKEYKPKTKKEEFAITRGVYNRGEAGYKKAVKEGNNISGYNQYDFYNSFTKNLRKENKDVDRYINGEKYKSSTGKEVPNYIRDTYLSNEGINEHSYDSNDEYKQLYNFDPLRYMEPYPDIVGDGEYLFEDGGSTSSWKPSQEILDYILKTEKFEPNIYLDGNGKETIGYGFIGKDIINKHRNTPIKEKEAREIFDDRIVPEFTRYLIRYTENFDKLNNDQKDALFSYLYNIGVKQYRDEHPKLHKALQEEDWRAAAQNIDAGYFDSNNDGLRGRRNHERELFGYRSDEKGKVYPIDANEMTEEELDKGIEKMKQNLLEEILSIKNDLEYSDKYSTTRGEAFREARRRGKKTFVWDGKTYTTDIKEEGGATSSWKPSDAILQYIKDTEAFRPEVYTDGKGHKTIGYGFTDKDLIKEYEGRRMSKEAAEKIFNEALVPEFTRYLVDNTENFDKLSPTQKDALFSYLYNIGVGNYATKNPKLHKALQNEDWMYAAQNLDFGYNDEANSGLKKRRNSERVLFGYDSDDNGNVYPIVDNYVSTYGPEKKTKQEQLIESILDAKIETGMPDRMEDAFRKAVKDGLDEYEWDGKKYRTKKEDGGQATYIASRDHTSVGGPGINENIREGVKPSGSIDITEVVAGGVPVVGDVMDVIDLKKSISEGDDIGIALSLAGMIPVVGGLATPFKRIRNKKEFANKFRESLGLFPDYAKPNYPISKAWISHRDRLVNGNFKRKTGDNPIILFDKDDIYDPYAFENKDLNLYDVNDETDMMLLSRKIGHPYDDDFKKWINDIQKEHSPIFVMHDENAESIISGNWEGSYDKNPAFKTKEGRDAAYSHEVDHLVGYPSSSPFDDNGFTSDGMSEKAKEYFTRRNGTEISARGSQIKDYFGLSNPDQEVTENMLLYAKDHYVDDYGINNNMTEFFNSISDYKKAAKWISENSTVGLGLYMLPKSIKKEDERRKKEGGAFNKNITFDDALGHREEGGADNLPYYMIQRMKLNRKTDKMEDGGPKYPYIANQDNTAVNRIDNPFLNDIDRNITYYAGELPGVTVNANLNEKEYRDAMRRNAANRGRKYVYKGQSEVVQPVIEAFGNPYVQGALSFFPLVGDAMDASDFVNSMKDGDKINMLLNASAFIPIVGDITKRARAIRDSKKLTGRKRLKNDYDALKEYLDRNSSNHNIPPFKDIKTEEDLDNLFKKEIERNRTFVRGVIADNENDVDEYLFGLAPLNGKNGRRGVMDDTYTKTGYNYVSNSEDRALGYATQFSKATKRGYNGDNGYIGYMMIGDPIDYSSKDRLDWLDQIDFDYDITDKRVVDEIMETVRDENYNKYTKDNFKKSDIDKLENKSIRSMLKDDGKRMKFSDLYNKQKEIDRELKKMGPYTHPDFFKVNDYNNYLRREISSYGWMDNLMKNPVYFLDNVDDYAKYHEMYMRENDRRTNFVEDLIKSKLTKEPKKGIILGGIDNFSNKMSDLRTFIITDKSKIHPISIRRIINEDPSLHEDDKKDMVSNILSGKMFEDGGPTKIRQKQAYDYLTMKRGMSKIQALAILGNLMTESGLQDNIYGDNNTSYGIQQWHNERMKKLFDHERKKGHSSPSFEDQLEFLADEYEGKTGYSNFLYTRKGKEGPGYYNYSRQDFQNANNLYDAVIAWNQGAGRPHKSVIRNSERYLNAMKIADNLGIEIQEDGLPLYSQMGYVNSIEGMTAAEPVEAQPVTGGTEETPTEANNGKSDEDKFNSWVNTYGKDIIAHIMSQEGNKEDTSAEDEARYRQYQRDSEDEKRRALINAILPNIQLKIKGVTEV